MPSLIHKSTIQYLVGSHSAKEGAPLADQLIFFSLLWVIITTSISYLGRDNFSIDQPTSWLMVFLPLMGLYLLSLSLLCHFYWKGMGKASLHLAKVSFLCNDNIRGYVEFKDLSWHSSSEATAHISLKNKHLIGENKEKWITKAQTQTTSGNKGIRVSFSSLVRPTLDEQPSPKNYTWCLHIALKHNNESYKEDFEIPMGENKERVLTP